MKKIILAITLLTSAIISAQSVSITTVLDGSCKRGTMPRVVEIYADGDVDFSAYQLQKQVDDNDFWSTDLDMSILGKVSDSFVYLIGSGEKAVFKKEFENITENVYETDALTIDGNDRVRIIRKSDGTVVDQYGISKVNGKGEKWEYTNSYAQRKAGNTGNGVFKSEDWVFAGKEKLFEIGRCYGDDPINTVVTLGKFEPKVFLEATSAKFKGLQIQLSNRTLYTTKGEIDKIYGVSGKSIENKNLPSGLYFVVIKNDGKSENINVVIP